MNLTVEDSIKETLLEYKHSNDHFEMFVSVELLDGTNIENVKLIKYYKPENNYLDENPFDLYGTDNILKYEEVFRNHSIGLNYVSKIRKNENEIIEEFWTNLGECSGQYDFENEDGYFSPYHLFSLQMQNDKYFNYKIARNNVNSKHLLSFPDGYSYSDIKNIFRNKLFIDGKLISPSEDWKIIEKFLSQKHYGFAVYFSCIIDLNNIEF